MTATAEQRTALTAFRAVVSPLGLRVTVDAEGFPVVQGRYGRIEWYCDGQDCHSCPLPGKFALAVFTDRPRFFRPLRAIPGVRRYQTGDQEMRAVFLPDVLRQVVGVIQARRLRKSSPAQLQNLALTRRRFSSRAKDAPGCAGMTTASPGLV